ncbi:carboxyl transferase domain-containing protein [uncultured Ruthenibacterium sp.]|uniref:carboxyl transferase domain-containing protein n=1 Tax=uncultured Ruthenibacterium sp. TaxID=1905347 RepID=UPI00349EF5D3
MAKATSGKEVLAKFFDEGAYQTLYADANSAVTAAFGSANGTPVYAVCQNGAAMCAKDTEKVVKVLDMAGKTGNPVVTFYNSIGSKLEEGLAALAGSANVAAAVARLSGVVPQIAVVTGVCGAGSALAAAGADICVMSKEGELFLTAPFTSAAAGDKVENAGSAEYAAKAGVATIVVDNAEEAAVKAAELVALLPANNLAGAAVFESAAPTGALNLAKYAAADAVKALVDADSAVELYAGFGKNVITALATVGGSVVGIVATEKALCRECVSKTARFVRLCDAFSIPVVTVVNTDGFVASSSEEEAGGLREAARLTGTYADATTAKVAVVTGSAVGTAYTALANADLTIAVEGCTISALDPKAAVTVLYKDELEKGNNIAGDTQKLAAKYAAEVCSASSAVEAGLADFAVDAASVRATLVGALDMLSTKRTQRMPKKHGNMSL